MKKTVSKKILSALLAAILCVALLMSFTACTEESPQNPDATGTETTPSTTTAADELDVLWQDATCTEDTTVGDGAKTFEFEVICGKNSVTFTVNTDETNLGEALLKEGLVEGDEGQYGLYVKRVNGVTADYDVNQYYWSFTKNGEMMMTGVDGEEIEAGAHYEMTVAK